MEKALVVGASGGMGYSVVKELSSRGISVTAFARTRDKLEKLFGNDPNVTIYAGDLFKVEDLEEAAQGVDVIFQAANIPYSEWEMKLLVMMSNIIETAKKHSAKVAFVDNIYAYGRSTGTTVNERTPKNPHTKKGKLRLQVEELIKTSKVPALIAHFPDFYGPNAESSLLNYTLVNVIKNKKASYVGDQSIAREFIYTPDGAKAIVELSLNEEAYGQNWNIPAQEVISGEEIIKTIRDITDYQKGVSTVSKKMIQFLGIFNPQMREAVEMYYLNEEPVVLNGEKYEKLIGPIPHTCYREGLMKTMEYMKKQA
ncbi:SDR family NAD(P)-dependent oxidoreductase [Peribacillus sp. NPDC097295]|uniref:SDR family NAD(P)-dependent oxidoreductase n=1 Tax=Peribacillus sp. NPDC097295 TaxID=3364402 RepID=UPI0038209C3F